MFQIARFLLFSQFPHQTEESRIRCWKLNFCEPSISAYSILLTTTNIWRISKKCHNFFIREYFSIIIHASLSAKYKFSLISRKPFRILECGLLHQPKLFSIYSRIRKYSEIKPNWDTIPCKFQILLYSTPCPPPIDTLFWTKSVQLISLNKKCEVLHSVYRPRTNESGTVRSKPNLIIKGSLANIGNKFFDSISIIIVATVNSTKSMVFV